MSMPLFSVVIASFMQYDIIRECIDSVLSQDYSDIELIVCNDATDDFRCDAIGAYIAEHKRDNLKSYTVIQNDIRLGTVRNVNQAFTLAKGEYLKSIAADDALWHNGVLSEYVQVFDLENANVISGRCLVVDESGHITAQYPEPRIWKLMNICTPKELFEENVYTNIIHSPGVALRKSFWLEMGRFNEDYFLAEDWPLWLKISRLGYRFHTVRNPVVRYRYGGVSNSTDPEIKQYKGECWKDIIQCMEKEVLPYTEMLSHATVRGFKYALRLLRLFYYRDFVLDDSKGLKKTAYKLRFNWFCFERVCRIKFREWKSVLVLKSVIIPFIVSLLFLFSASSVSTGNNTQGIIVKLLMLFSAVTAVYGVIQAFRYALLICKQILRFIKRKLTL